MAAQEDETVIESIVSAQRQELEQEIASLETEAERVAEEARELAGEVPF
jgi:cell division protein FtsB